MPEKGLEVPNSQSHEELQDTEYDLIGDITWVSSEPNVYPTWLILTPSIHVNIASCG
jgi:hypothetical protein